MFGKLNPKKEVCKCSRLSIRPIETSIQVRAQVNIFEDDRMKTSDERIWCFASVEKLTDFLKGIVTYQGKELHIKLPYDAPEWPDDE